MIVITGWLIDGPNRNILYFKLASQRNILWLVLSISYPVCNLSDQGLLCSRLNPAYRNYIPEVYQSCVKSVRSDLEVLFEAMTKAVPDEYSRTGTEWPVTSRNSIGTYLEPFKMLPFTIAHETRTHPSQNGHAAL